jgi:hypothetical protein
MTQPEHQIILYTTANGAVNVEVAFEGETFWLSQKRMAELFGVQRPAITKHLSHIFETGELEENQVCSILEHTAEDGKTYKTMFYNLDAIIAVGYRVNSRQATQFRIWATQTLKEFIIKGFALDDNRLKQGKKWGKDYFDELLERIREIRASERRFYQKITDIYEQCSVDYAPNVDITQMFFATVQNKLHWAIHGHTAAELVHERADSTQPNMGLKTWKNAPKGKILKTDVSIAKNYLDAKEIDLLNRVVGMYLDFAEIQASKQIPMKMEDWIKRLDAFLKFNEFEVLNHAGKVSAEIARQLAYDEYEKYRPIQDNLFESDFDRVIKNLPKSEGKRGRSNGNGDDV